MSFNKVPADDRTTLLQIIARNLLVAAGVLDSNSLPMVQVTDRTTLLQIIAAASIDLANGGGGGGGGVWGAITGTLSAQADLQSALDAKVTSAGGSIASTAGINANTQTAFNAKANLAGGNTFAGDQVFNNNVGGPASVWSVNSSGEAAFGMIQSGAIVAASYSSPGGDAIIDIAGNIIGISLNGPLTYVSVPNASSDPGIEGQYSADTDYFYYYVGGTGWFRIQGQAF